MQSVLADSLVLPAVASTALLGQWSLQYLPLPAACLVPAYTRTHVCTSRHPVQPAYAVNLQ